MDRHDAAALIPPGRKKMTADRVDRRESRWCAALAVGALCASGCGAAAQPMATAATDRVASNDNTVAAGTLRSGALDLHLEVRRGEWYLLGDNSEPGAVLAFAERGGPLQIPGPLIRVPVGTTVRVQIDNPTDSTLVVHGLSARHQPVLDTLVVPARGSVEHRFVADVVGTYYYWGTTTRAPLDSRMYEDSQLGGAFIVDPAGGSAPDRVFVLGLWLDSAPLADGSPDFSGEYAVLNGRPWPLTERLTYELGDSIRWRVINASFDVHPMHLHGFYYRVDARGDLARDSIFWPAQQRMAVTERLLPGQTITLVWSPDRPGGWLFHCHLSFHVLANPGRGAQREDAETRQSSIRLGHPHHDPQNHVETGMGGLMLATTVTAPPDWEFDEPAFRELRLFINSDSVAGASRRFAYVLMEDDVVPAPDSLRLPGSTLVLRRGEPTGIRVFNRSTEPTQIHWHGLELQSYYDGVVGVGGHPGMPTPPIMPGDSFEMRITPPRAGSFMYHTHMNDVKQQTEGLYGAIVVLEPDEAWDPARDIVLMVGNDRAASRVTTLLNGRAEHQPIELRVGEGYRLRLMNITVGGPNLRMRLVRADGAIERWTLHMKDGHAVPLHRRVLEDAEQQVSIGETYDFLFRPTEPGDLTYQVRNQARRLIATQPFRVVP
jgi:manganese oxidase